MIIMITRPDKKPNLVVSPMLKTKDKPYFADAFPYLMLSRFKYQNILIYHAAQVFHIKYSEFDHDNYLDMQTFFVGAECSFGEGGGRPWGGGEEVKSFPGFFNSMDRTNCKFPPKSNKKYAFNQTTFPHWHKTFQILTKYFYRPKRISDFGQHYFRFQPTISIDQNISDSDRTFSLTDHSQHLKRTIGLGWDIISKPMVRSLFWQFCQWWTHLHFILTSTAQN